MIKVNGMTRNGTLVTMTSCDQSQWESLVEKVGNKETDSESIGCAPALRDPMLALNLCIIYSEIPEQWDLTGVCVGVGGRVPTHHSEAVLCNKDEGNSSHWYFQRHIIYQCIRPDTLRNKRPKGTEVMIIYIKHFRRDNKKQIKKLHQDCWVI